MATPIDLGHQIWQIDLFEQGLPFRTAAYFIEDEQLTLIETGSSLSHDILVENLAFLGYTPADLSYVIVTHVHLDHAGGAGHMMEKAPQAKLVVHPRGERHMVDPTRLWDGAKAVYKERLGALFGCIKPIAKAQILIKNHGDTLSIGKRTLTFFDSPGHAKHHFTILDPLANALFAGDAIGVRYRREFTGWNFEFVMPSSSPIDFDPAAVHRTLDFLTAQPFDWVYHAHFGRSPKNEAIASTHRVADAFADVISSIYHPGITVAEIVSALRKWVSQDLTKQGFQPGPLEALDIDMFLDAMGLLYYFEHK